MHHRQPAGLNGRTDNVWSGRIDHDEQDLGRHEPSLHSGNFSTPRDITSGEDAISTAMTSAIPAVTSDESLMVDLRAGGEGGARLFERYRDPVWRFFRRRVADPARAEELTQDVFTAVLEAAPRYQPLAPFRSYLFGIAYNVLLASRRKGQITIPLDEDLTAAKGADPDDALWVRTALSRLDPMDREVLMLREYEQLSYQEIADVQRIPLNTVRSRLFRARMSLRDALMPDAVHEEHR
jgi:RNA polymerase sigma factor (sigma-70 family)